jgi:hypothetical protein
MALFLVQVGFIGFVTSLFVAVWRGFGADGTARRTLRVWILAAGLFFVLWVIGLRSYPVPLSQ